MKKKILITGILGYIGTELVSILDSEKYDIIGIDQDFIPDKVANLIKNNIKFYQRDLFNIKDLLVETDVVIHLAAITKVPMTPKQCNPEINELIRRIGIDGTNEIINNVKSDCKIIFTSTHVCWENLQETIFDLDENYPTCAILPYAKSKVQNEIDLENSGRNYTIFRLGTVYGYNPCVRFSVGNLFAKMASQNQTLKLFGGGFNYKSLVGINDVARAIIESVDWSKYDNNTFNLVNDNLTVKDIAEICIKYNPEVQSISTDDEIINKGYTVSNKKIRDVGFEFRQNLEQEVSQMIKNWKNKSI